MWHIYGNEYDLTKFIDEHPGGSYILNMTKGLKDITLLFETYHTFANRTKLIEMLEKYRINKELKSISYDYNNNNILKVNHYEYSNVDYEFLLKLDQYENSNYNKILDIIKMKYQTRFHIKASPQFILYNMIILLCYLLFFYLSMFSDNNMIFRCLFSIIAGFLWTIILVNIMHNSSHFALTSNPIINYRITKLINNFSFWNNNSYYYNHICKNHLYNIEIKNKNNIIKFVINNNDVSIINKHFTLNTKNYLNLSNDNYHYIEDFINNTLLHNIFPTFDKYDILIMLISYGCLYYGGFIYSTLYGLTYNYLYNIVINYNDMIGKNETWIVEYIYNKNEKYKNSTLFTKIFNNINYKLEHFLFPNINSEYYPEISNIIIKYCYDNNINYSIDDIISPTVNSNNIDKIL